MLGPGNDNGTPDVMLEAGYENLMEHMAQPLIGIVALCVETESGSTGVFTWKYGHSKPKTAMAAISEDPHERLSAIGGALECAVRCAEREGLTVAG
jgi:hypothetical protein